MNVEKVYAKVGRIRMQFERAFICREAAVAEHLVQIPRD